ncbi:MAG TPA: putative metal-binding motif-containing protein [Pyrinomonadaceae bacterium]|nr:putative metal-binding motif-containing protein [Pyrinomonadaceae bacterium]
MRSWKAFTLSLLAALVMTIGTTAAVMRDQEQKPKVKTRPPASPSPTPSPTPNCVDQDRDGYGVGSQCVGARDCNDTNATVHPGGTEVCDKLDNDCNGVIDDKTPGAPGNGCP